MKRDQNWVLNIVFLNKKSVQELNKNHRNIDKATDVLSFHYFDDFSMVKSDDTAGEIILCEEIIKSQWKEHWLWDSGEFYKLLIHSVIHILWYDHEDDEDYIIMNDLEEQVAKAACISL